MTGDGLLDGRVAVVTGASRGLGKGIALALADEGATVQARRTALRADLKAGAGVGAASETSRRSASWHS